MQTSTCRTLIILPVLHLIHTRQGDNTTIKFFTDCVTFFATWSNQKTETYSVQLSFYQQKLISPNNSCWGTQLSEWIRGLMSQPSDPLKITLLSAFILHTMFSFHSFKDFSQSFGTKYALELKCEWEMFEDLVLWLEDTPLPPVHWWLLASGLG